MTSKEIVKKILTLLEEIKKDKDLNLNDTEYTIL